MSHDIVKSISIKKENVYLTLAANNIRPLHFRKVEWGKASEALRAEGRLAALSMIGENIWDGNFRLYKGTKLCNLFLAAREALPSGLSFHNFDSEIAGKYLGKMVLKLESDIAADLTPEVKEMLEYQNNREYILNAARTKGYNFLNYASEEIQTDREFALEVLKAGGSSVWFDYPVNYRKDKEFAIEALKLNGCFFRRLDESLQQDRELIMLAYREDFPKRRFHEHLPDCIPESVYINKEDGVLDSDFVCKLLDICPSLHLERSGRLLTDRAVAKKWCEVGKFFPSSASHLLDIYLKEPSFQDILLKRCDTDEKLKRLEKIYLEKGIDFSVSKADSISPSSKQSFESQIQNAEKESLKLNTAEKQTRSILLPER